MPHSEQSLGQQAFKLVQSLSNYSGSFSSAVYDTAWVSMIQHNIDDRTEYLFPEAFHYLLETQLPDGSWPSYSSITDGILNTLAALLALKNHSRNSSEKASNVEGRCSRAESALRSMIKEWDIHSTDRVGLEILVPGILRLLGKEGISFEFPGLQEITKLGEAKLAHFGKALQGKAQTTLLHSLEAFIGTLDFDSIKHHKLPNGSMLNSPASTAAYLIHASIWDDEAEAYLRIVMNRSDDGGLKGGVPSAYPTPIFELAWVTTTLILTSFSAKDCGEDNLTNITYFLNKTMQDQDWLVGFAPGCLPDADDTAKTLLALRMLNQEANYEPMLANFEKGSYFITYPGERNPSFSANCNVLACLLQSNDLKKHTHQIAKCAAFLDDAWRNGRTQDKWNTSVYYSIMLLAQAFTRFIKVYEDKQLDPSIDMASLSCSMRATLLDMYIHIVEHQEEEGSWSSKHEVTAYATLALSSLLVLPWPSSVKAPGISCLAKGKIYLLERQHLWTHGDYLWIEKVAYSSSNLCYAYCLAAANLPVPDQSATQTMSIDKQVQFFSSLPTFSNHPQKVEAYLTQSSYFVPLLQNMQHSIFPELGSAEAHKYLKFIPFTWIGCNHQHNTRVSMAVLWEMMLISMLNYQTDLYMESFVTEKLSENLDDVRRAIDRAIISASQRGEKRNGEEVANGTRKRAKADAANGTMPNGAASHDTSPTTNGDSKPPIVKDSSKDDSSLETHLASLEATLVAFATHILRHPLVLLSPSYLQNWLSSSLRTFLQAHITQIVDCTLLSHGILPKTTYYLWVHTTSADHTSCPYSFVFYLCLMHGAQAQTTPSGKPPVNLFRGAKTKYVLEDACRRLAAMCRQQNDFGSVERDRKEGNLNSIDFPEFDGGSEDDGLDARIQRAKKEMLEIVEYKRKSVDAALAELRSEVSASVMDSVMLFFHVTNLFGEIYLTRDMSPPMKSLNRKIER